MQAFETDGFDNYWLQHLPKKVPSNNCSQPALLEEVCAMCECHFLGPFLACVLLILDMRNFICCVLAEV
jgi:hypothetical protein